MEREDDRDNPLRVVFGAHNLRLSDRFAQRFDVRVLEAYGSTEIGFVVEMSTDASIRPG